MACVFCNEYGCDRCNQTGFFQITQCPKALIDKQTLDLFQAERLTETIYPLSGGWLNQTQSFIDALDWLKREKTRWACER